MNYDSWSHTGVRCVHGWQALDLNGGGFDDVLLPQCLQDGLWELHLAKGLDGRWDVLAFCQNVPLLAYALVSALWGVADVLRGSPAGLEGLRVGDPSGQLPHAHQGTRLLDVVEDLFLFHALLVQL